MSTVIDEFFGTYKAEVITYRRADIAARVLAGLAVRGSYCTAADAAEQAVELTDALIERLEKAPDPEPPKWAKEQMQPKETPWRCPRTPEPPKWHSDVHHPHPDDPDHGHSVM